VLVKRLVEIASAEKKVEEVQKSIFSPYKVCDARRRTPYCRVSFLLLICTGSQVKVADKKGCSFLFGDAARDDDEVIQTLQLVWQQISLRGYNIVRRVASLLFRFSRVIFFYIATSYLK
jgi:hypothetical protein